MKKLFLFTAIILFMAACEKEEIALDSPLGSNSTTPMDTSSGESVIQKGVLISSSVNIGEDYSKQVWFDLGTNAIVKINLRTDWDLAFDCSINHNLLYLNSALGASVAFTNETDFDKVTSDAGLTYTYEHHSGRKDSMAIGEVSNLRNVLILNRGYTPSNDEIGKLKIQITSAENGEYHITYAKLDGSNQQTAVISKSPQYNKVAYSFTTNEVLQIEPPKTDYDLCFTQYTFIYTVPPQAYSVNGALINSYNTEVAKEFQKDFSKITKDDAQNLFYSNIADVIGHHWKDFNLQNDVYQIYTNQNYLIKDAAGNLFKLHFLDFYDENGVKGAPSFEYVRL